FAGTASPVFASKRSTRLATELLPLRWAASSRAVTAGAWSWSMPVVRRSISHVAAAPATAPRRASRAIDMSGLSTRAGRLRDLRVPAHLDAVASGRPDDLLAC